MFAWNDVNTLIHNFVLWLYIYVSGLFLKCKGVGVQMPHVFLKVKVLLLHLLVTSYAHVSQKLLIGEINN